jgi:hypothetical protein
MMRSTLKASALILALAMSLPAAALELSLTAGFDVEGQLVVGELDTENGYSLGLEATFDAPRLELGLGFEYGFPRGAEVGDGEVDYKHFYGLGRLTLVGPLYLVGRVGWADVSIDDILDVEVDGGETWSVGAGLGALDRLKVELLFNDFTANIDDRSIDYETYSLRVIYTF